MKTIASIPALTAIATLLIASGALAAAPAPAPAPKAEETCTVEKMEKPDVECLECKAASLADPEACDRKMKGTEYMAECRAGGREAWTEVWCRKKERAEKAAAHMAALKASEIPGFTTEGLVGLRLNHNLDVDIRDFGVSK